MKKVIPPVLFLFCIVLMIGLRSAKVIWEVIPRPFNYAGAMLIVVGLAMTISIRKQFSKADTEIHTFKRPRKLVTSGLFSVTRNPIYLGFTISLVGTWLLLGTFLPLLGCLLFVLAAHYWYIPYEEQAAQQEFGEEYQAYASKVRRWI